MKTIITTVGTSVFTNLTKDGENDEIKKRFEQLKQKRYSEWATFESRSINDRGSRLGLKTLVQNAIKANQKASAEIESILKIAKDEKVNIHLLATDTVLSVLAAQIIVEWEWLDGKQKITFNPTYEQDVIKDLQVENLMDFKKGLRNLVERFYKIYGTNPNPKDYILNITGGYKGIIPFMTLLGQMTKIDINYKFEETGSLIEIPRLPIKRDDELFDEHFEVFQEIEEEVEIEGSKYYAFVQKAESCLETFNNGKTYTLNALGLVFWEDYKNEYFNFYCSDDVWSTIQKQNDISRILATKLYDKKQRISKNKVEREHKTMFKDGNNDNRIYYFEKGQTVYIYKTFENHAKHEIFLKTPFNNDIKQEIIKNSKPRKIKINHV